jgi:2-isopropylmalate synthase
MIMGWPWPMPWPEFAAGRIAFIPPSTAWGSAPAFRTWRRRWWPITTWKPLLAAAGYLEKVSGFFLAPNKPITGQNAFTHKSGVHTNGILKDPRTYEPFDPALLGRERKIVIDKYTGKSAVAARLDEYSIQVSPAELEVIVTRIKNLGDNRKQLFDTDIIEIAEQVTGREIDVIPHDISALVMLEVESHVYTSAVVRRLRGFEDVSSVYEVTGEYDISAFVNVENVMALNNLIEELRTVTGVKRTETRLILKKYSGNANGDGGSNGNVG